MVNGKLLMVICYSLFVIFLILIIWEDFKYRGVRWWLFPLMGVVALGIEFESLKILDIVYNTCFILTQLILLTLYFSIKEKKMVNISQRYLGWGDILFWGVACLLFAPLNFLFFFMASLVFTMVLVLGWRIAKIKPEMVTVPLAGIQALALLIVLVITFISNKISFRESNWLENLIGSTFPVLCFVFCVFLF